MDHLIMIPSVLPVPCTCASCSAVRRVVYNVTPWIATLETDEANLRHLESRVSTPFTNMVHNAFFLGALDSTRVTLQHAELLVRTFVSQIEIGIGVPFPWLYQTMVSPLFIATVKRVFKLVLGLEGLVRSRALFLTSVGIPTQFPNGWFMKDEVSNSNQQQQQDRREGGGRTTSAAAASATEEGRGGGERELPTRTPHDGTAH